MATAQSNAPRVKPQKPRPDFPLYPHPNGRWGKKCKGKTYCYGRWEDPEGALEEWLHEKPYREAGRTPPRYGNAISEGLPLHELVNRYLTEREDETELDEDGIRELSPRHFKDLQRDAKRLVAFFGRDRFVEDLGRDDFKQFRQHLLPGRRKSTVASIFTRVHHIFQYAHDEDWISTPVNMGRAAKGPKRRTKKLAKAKQWKGKLKTFTPAIIQAYLDAMCPTIKAMTLIAINTGCGNKDLGLLEFDDFDLDDGWIDVARNKTGNERRGKLWPETLDAVQAAMDVRRKPKPEFRHIVFITSRGNPFADETNRAPICRKFKT